jgi:hypothetical protein
MGILDDRVEDSIKKIEELHAISKRTNWGELNREGFVFELERSTQKLKEIFLDLEQINKEVKLLLEKDTPDMNDFLEEFTKELVVLESNRAMERTKKLRQELINETERQEIPELYDSLQQRILKIVLKARYNIEKVRTFLIAKKTPFIQKGSTAKNLIEILRKKEEEFNELKQKHLELKKNNFFGNNEKSLAEVEQEMFEFDKKLEMAVIEANKALKTHLAQLNYVEGSFVHLKEKVELVENIHNNYTTKAIELLKELKKERDFARKTVIEIEQETIGQRSEYTKKMLEMEEEKNDLEEGIRKKYLIEIEQMKNEMLEKSSKVARLAKVIEEQEKEIRMLKSKIKNPAEKDEIVVRDKEDVMLREKEDLVVREKEDLVVRNKDDLIVK